MLPLLEEVRGAVTVPVAGLPVPYRTTESQPTFQSLEDPGAPDPAIAARPFPDRARPVHLHRATRSREFTRAARRHRRQLPRRLLRRGAASHPQHGRGARPHAAGQPVHGRHVQALRSSATDPTLQRREPGVRRADVMATDGGRARSEVVRLALAQIDCALGDVQRTPAASGRRWPRRRARSRRHRRVPRADAHRLLAGARRRGRVACGRRRRDRGPRRATARTALRRRLRRGGPRAHLQQRRLRRGRARSCTSTASSICPTTTSGRSASTSPRVRHARVRHRASGAWRCCSAATPGSRRWPRSPSRTAPGC